jgi:hypothetical protein
MTIEEKYDRVTEVLSPFSGLKSLDAEILKNAGCRGKVVHILCNCLLKNLGIFDLEELVRSYTRNDEHFEKEKSLIENFLKSFEIWFEDKNDFITPSRFYDNDLMITGECDFIYLSEEGLKLVDLKTPIKESPTWSLQGSAYSYMAKQAKFNIQGIEFVQLSRTGKKPKIYQYEENFSLFKSYLDVYRDCYKNKKEEDVLGYL